MRATTTHTKRLYHAHYGGQQWTHGTDPVGFAILRTLLAGARRTHGPAAVTVTTSTVTERARLCEWCRARPGVRETRAAGTFELAVCNAGQCVHARDAAAAGAAPKPPHIPRIWVPGPARPV